MTKTGAKTVRLLLVMILASLLLSACAGTRPAPGKTPETGLPSPDMARTPGNGGRSSDARVAAAHNLTRTGYRLLRNNDFDGAIRVLERAVGVNPADGQGYFYLAEAWLGKKDFERAARFNNLAALYLRDDRQWARRAADQQERISRARAGEEPHQP